MTENEVAKTVVNICFKIHSTLGPGLLESVYEEVLFYELGKHRLQSDRQVPIPVVYEKIEMPIGFRADIIVEDELILELKSVETLAPVHYKQLLTYLKITGLKLGLLINFNVPLIKNGIFRVVNQL